MISICPDSTNRAVEVPADEPGPDYRALVETVKDALFSLNSRGELTFVNPAFTAITGWASQECLGRPFTSLLAPDDFFTGYSMLLKALAGDSPPPTELLLISRTGEPIPMEVLIRARQVGGRPTFLAGSGRDIRNRRNLEGQWQEVPKLDSLGRLAAGVSHHFNNLLTVQHGYLSLLLQEARGQPRLLSFINEVIAATDKATQLTREFLFFGRRKPMNLRPLALGRTLLNFTSTLKEAAGKSIDVEIRVRESLPSVLADRGMVEQVLLHLAANARDAMPQGGRLLVEMNLAGESSPTPTPEQDRGRRMICLSVTDTGVGIAPEHLDQVFDPFFSTKTLQEGVGLGLAAVHGIVQQHGGWIEVKSARNHGTTFRVYLPEAEFSLHPAQTGNSAWPHEFPKILRANL